MKYLVCFAVIDVIAAVQDVNKRSELANEDQTD
jgi:hypothetical protein